MSATPYVRRMSALSRSLVAAAAVVSSIVATVAVASPSAYVLEHLTSAEKLALAASPYPSAKALIEDARVAVADAVIARTAADAVVRTRAGFEAVRDALSAAVVDELFQTVSLTARILTAARDVERAMRDANSLTLLGALNDIKGQLAGLMRPVPPTVTEATPVADLFGPAAVTPLPLAVLDAEGRLMGVVPRVTLLSALGTHAEASVVTDAPGPESTENADEETTHV